jgi:hypothetical protein
MGRARWTAKNSALRMTRVFGVTSPQRRITTVITGTATASACRGTSVCKIE